MSPQTVCTAGRSGSTMLLRALRALIAVLALLVLTSCVWVGTACASEEVQESFGVEDFANSLAGEGSAPVLQAGAHPDTFTTTFVFNHVVEVEGENSDELEETPGGSVPIEVSTFGEPKNILDNLPVGVIVNPVAPAARCSEAELEEIPSRCPVASLVGVVRAHLAGFPYEAEGSLYDLVPPAGVAAQFGVNFAGLGFIVHINGMVRGGGAYALSAEAKSILPTFPIYSTTVTFFGDLSETETALLTTPTSCSGSPLVSVSEVDSWKAPLVESPAIGSLSGAVGGCGALRFDPSVQVTPESSVSSSPTGLFFDLHVPQDENRNDLATANLKDTTVTLPEGLTVDSSVANGLQACTPAQVGLEPTPNQRQAVTIERPRANTFTLEFEGHSTGALPVDASAEMVQEALESLPSLSAGELSVSALAGGWIVEFTGARSQQEAPQLSGMVSENAVQDVSVDGTGGSFDLAITPTGGATETTAASATGNLTEGSEKVTGLSGMTGTFVAGEVVSGTGIPAATTIVKVGSGTLKLSRAVEASGTGVVLSANIPYNASDATVRAALEGLPALGAGNVMVSGGFEDEDDILGRPRVPYVVTFVGGLAGTSVAQLTATSALTSESRRWDPAPTGRVTISSVPPGVQSLTVATVRQAGGVLHFSVAPPECPDASKIGTVELDTPLLDHPLPGSVFLASQGDNPFGSLLAMYIVIDDPVSGVIIKLAGHIESGEGGSSGLAPGQLRVTFDNNPQLPFEDFKVNLFGGSRASLSTPATCGTYTSMTDLVPWSAPEGSDAFPQSSFEIQSGPDGSACPQTAAGEPNDPSFGAGTFTPIAGAYSPFVLHLGREDGSQQFNSLSVTLPEGMIGKIAGVGECPQADIEAAEHRSGEGEGLLEQDDPSCPSSSEIGLAHVGVGSGAQFYVTGRAYLAGPYEGAPFSIVVITPALAGPYDLGTVVVRSALEIDPTTTQVTVRTDPFPSFVHGIPLDIRSIAVEATRNDFTLNPTSCEKTSVTGTVFGESSPASVSAPFQVGGCNGMPFRPSLGVSTSAKSSRADGTSVSFRLSYPAGALGREAWLRSAKFEFPKQLPARLSTIQKSCPAATFQANPSACPSPSRIGTAVVHTQVLPVPLEGPVYFVSYGSAKFPEAVFVLQGDNVTVDLHSETFINEKTGVTSATLPEIPGVPFEEATVTLPAGQYSEFTANGNLCALSKTVLVKKKVTIKVKVKVKGREKTRKETVTRTVKESVAEPLEMPTVFTGQNGAVLHQDTQIAITECPIAKKTVKHKKKNTKSKKDKSKKAKGNKGGGKK